MATLFKTNGEKKYLKPRRRGRFSLEELQKAVGGFIQYVPAGESHYMIVDEDGLDKHLPVNVDATAVIRQFGGPAIVGDAVFAEKNEIL